MVSGGSLVHGIARHLKKAILHLGNGKMAAGSGEPILGCGRDHREKDEVIEG